MVLVKERPLLLPIIQGGMGIGVSLGNLAGHVAKHGAMGVISAANPGFAEPDFWKNALRCNINALKDQIQKAKQIAQGNGWVAINAMVATTHYAETIQAAVEAGADAVISGAGLPSDLPAYVKGSNTAIAPIVSSGRAAHTICRMWDKRHKVCPDFIVIEGPMAGGHLGFHADELENGTAQTPEQILPEVLKEIKPYEEKYQKQIPVFVAGGVYTAEDVARFLKLGAAGVQVGTRFIATEECDASQRYKEILVNAKKEDICIIKSPVGMPGRALNSPLIERLRNELRIPVQKCVDCLHPCNPATTPYCITKALSEAVRGNWDEGLFFCGSNAWKLDRILPVQKLLEELKQGWRDS
ncbi:NAD(P)H-dependent flavin oxidoreductase [Clostridium merdae]|uniref:NAD(P)H-dependent flavin oxidoreductase n=1 Tax=Clostridium merdae TaxID=1958780 RepID=UPI000A270CA4|nr:nitronate monooxygenase family protein [Clostridium merdae]